VEPEPEPVVEPEPEPVVEPEPEPVVEKATNVVADVHSFDHIKELPTLPSDSIDLSSLFTKKKLGAGL